LKLVIIIAIAVVWPVAVFGVIEGGEFLMAILIELKEQPIVDSYNQEINRCRTAFDDNRSFKKKCEWDAIEKFGIWRLSKGSIQKSDSAFPEDIISGHLGEKPKSMQERFDIITTALIQHHEGCGDFEGCWGPRGSYFTILGSELRYLLLHMIASIISGFVVFGILSRLKKKDKIKIPTYWMITVSVIDVVLLFFLFAYLFPSQWLY